MADESGGIDLPLLVGSVTPSAIGGVFLLAFVVTIILLIYICKRGRGNNYTGLSDQQVRGDK